LDNLTANNPIEQARLVELFAAFDKSWLNYWTAYVDLQNQLYESLRAGREISWLAATNPEKINEINVAQRELFATMPRRIDYMPLGQINRSLDSAQTKLDELESTLSKEEESCKRLMSAIQVLRQQITQTRQGLKARP
jgi:hypothetical protein